MERNNVPAAISIRSIDHVVITVNDLDATLAFYNGILGMRVERFGEGRIALHFGSQKLNVHVVQHPLGLVADVPTPGSLDLCFIAETPVADVVRAFEAHGVEIVQAPSTRTGACGAIWSVYVRDPDGNLVEISNYQ
jgi:catechol 2,3-dioxygenase-like lactoylglutathione lyase family enzyme